MHSIFKFVCTVRNKKTSLLILLLLLMIGITPLTGQENNTDARYVGLFSTRGNIFYTGVSDNLDVHIIGE